MDPRPEAHKPWLSREVSIQWVIGLALVAIWWVIDRDKQQEARIGQVAEQMAQRPDLVERRNRELDKLEACMNRQIELVRSCKR